MTQLLDPLPSRASGTSRTDPIRRAPTRRAPTRRALTRRAPTRRALRVAVIAGAGVGTVALALHSPAASAQLGGSKKVTVELKNLQFKPKKLEIAKGTQVDFVWKENVAHNVVIDKLAKSKNVSKGTWSYVFATVGKFKFKCTIHPGMEGTVTVK